MGLAYNRQINPRQVGLAPCSRDSYSVNSEDVHALAHDIVFDGWPWGEHTRPRVPKTFQEVTPLTYAEKFCESSRPLAPVDKGSIRFGSLSRGHTNMALRCIAASRSSGVPLLFVSGPLL